jgi:hypothetical protein
MNVTTKTGYICVDILKKGHKEGWSHALTFQSVALSIVSLLDDPNPGAFFVLFYICLSNLLPIFQIVHLVRCSTVHYLRVLILSQWFRLTELEIANIYEKDRKEHDSRAREHMRRQMAAAKGETKENAILIE